MGWFRRGGSGASDDGLYRGDAPVFAPGVGDDAPRAYTSGTNWIPAPSPSSPPAMPDRLGPPGASAPPVGAGPVPWNTPAPGQWTAPGQVAPPPTRRKGPGAGCGLTALLVIVALAGLVGFGIYQGVRSAIPSLNTPDTQVGEVDLPVTVDYGDGRLRITVSGVQAQPGSGWDDPAGEPTLLITTSIERVDDGPTSVHVPFFDWGFTPSGASSALDLDIISGFEPDLTTITLDAGDTVSGLLPFATDATAGRLQLAARGYPDSAVVTWDLTATVAQPVAGTAGVPALAQIGRPPFTVTLDATGWTDQAGVGAWNPPASGGFLTADLTVTSTGSEFSEWIEDADFVFVPAGGAPVAVVPPGTAPSVTTFATVADGASATLRAVFDVTPGPGTLEMRDAAGRTMVSWPVASG